jgi:uncharacterized membrane protein
VLHGLQGFRREYDGSILCKLLEKVLEQIRQVLHVLAQRWHDQRDDVEAIVEVAPEGPARDRLLHIAVGSGDHAHVDANRLPSLTDAMELAVLEYAKQLRPERARTA